MAGQVGGMDWSNISWFGVVLSAILGFTQFISNSNPQVLEFSEVKARIVSLCFSVSLVALTASTPLPSCKVFKISIIGVVLGCAMLLSASAPAKLFWVPYLSCIRPLFHLTPGKFQEFSKTHWKEGDLAFLRFSKTLWKKAELAFQRFSKTVWNKAELAFLRICETPWKKAESIGDNNLATDDARTVASSPATSSSLQVNLNLESTSSPSISAATQLAT